MNFAEALNIPTEEIKRSPLPPVGNYQWNIAKFDTGQAGEDWDTCTFVCNPVNAMPDVDPTMFESFLSAANGLAGFQKMGVRKQFMLPKDPNEKLRFDNTLAEIKEFLEIDCGVQGATLKELLANCVNHQFIGRLEHRADKQNPETKYLEIRKTAPLA